MSKPPKRGGPAATARVCFIPLVQTKRCILPLIHRRQNRVSNRRSTRLSGRKTCVVDILKITCNRDAITTKREEAVARYFCLLSVRVSPLQFPPTPAFFCRKTSQKLVNKEERGAAYQFSLAVQISRVNYVRRLYIGW